MVEECAIYLGVYGHRYGWAIPDEGVSISSPRIVFVRFLKGLHIIFL
jgi:hypothetical protein